MAPEVARGLQYTNSGDIWAVGIIMHIILAQGKHPFYNREIDNVDSFKKKLVKLTDIVIDPVISDLAKNLINKLAHTQASHRYSAKDALKHPWITRRNDNSIPMSFTEQINNFELESSLLLKVRLVHFLAYAKLKSKAF